MRLVEVLGDMEPVPSRSRWIRALLGFGILLFVVGVVCGDGRLVLEDLVVGSAGSAWFWLRRWRAARAAGRNAATPSRGLAGPPAD